jgi:hypothetical protein
MKNVLTSLLMLFTLSMTSQVIKYPIDTIYYFEFPAHMDIETARQWGKTKSISGGTYEKKRDLYWIVNLKKQTLKIYGTKYQITNFSFPNSTTLIVEYKLDTDTTINRRIMFYTDEYGYEKMLFTIEQIDKDSDNPNKGGWGYVKQEGGQ